MVEGTKDGWRYGGRTPTEEGGTTQCASEVGRTKVHGTELGVEGGTMKGHQKGKELRRSGKSRMLVLRMDATGAMELRH